jgi:hypothetical protein
MVPSRIIRVPSESPGMERRPVHAAVTSPVPSESRASRESYPSPGRTVILRTAAATLTGARDGQESSLVVPGTVSAHSRTSPTSRSSSVSVNRCRNFRNAVA